MAKTSEPRSTARWLIGRCAPYRGKLGLGILATTLASALDGITLLLLIPLLRHLFGSAGALSAGNTQLEQLVDRYLSPIMGQSGGTGVTLRLVGLLWAALLIKNFLSYLASQLSVLAQEGLVRDLRSDLFAHLLRLDLGWLERTRGGQVISRVMQDADQSKLAISAGLASFVQNLVLILTTLLVLAQLSWQLTILTLAGAPILVIGVRHLLTRLRKHARSRANEAGEMTATVSERLAAVKLIRSYGGEIRESQRFRDQADRYRRAVARTQRLATLTSPVSEIFGGLLLVLLVGAGASGMFTGGRLSPEAMLVFIIAALRIMAPLKAITQFPSQMSIALASAERVREVLLLPAPEEEPAGLPAASFTRSVRYESIWFRYPGTVDDRWVLRDISFDLPRGKTVALVGPSGSGKTTLAELLPRLREPVQGMILLDGVPIDQCSRASVRELLGFVGQETVLFNDTVRANIAYGRPTATSEQLEAAARAANAHSFIERLPQGYDTILGERGTRLSGGQRQRIAIARAILRDPPILILDEATSALDPESERLVQDALARLMQDRTVLVIAHRLGTVRHADEILLLEEGQITERGTHNELITRGGRYAQMVGTVLPGAASEIQSP